MTEPYLILHKVRGEPAFDIAIQIQMKGEDEPWWIIPTSGHRAYPYWNSTLHDVCIGGHYHLPPFPVEVMPDYPDGFWFNWPSCPDHYSLNKSPDPQTTPSIPLLHALGLVEPIKRRI